MALVTRARFDAIVLDLDGTLLDGAGRVTDAARREIARARDLGFLVVLATGRSLTGASGVHAELGLDTEVVAYNGAWVGRCDGTAPWHYATIPDELVSALGAVEGRAAFLFRHHRETKFTPRTAHPEHPRVMGWYRNVVPLEPGDARLPCRELVRVSLFYGDRPAVDDAWGALEDRARERLHREVFPMAIFPEFADTALVLCEVQGRGRGKVEALRLLEGVYGVPATRVVAVGDQSNDVALLRAAGLPVAMANAIPEARAAARLVIGDHREDGVARFLERELG